MNECECGCGEPVAEGKRFVRGHHLRLREDRQRKTCTTHCSRIGGGCGQHFTGTAAFDAHLVRIDLGLNTHGVREYELRHLPGTEAELEVAVADGVCSLATPEESGIVVWRSPLQMEAA